MHESESELSSDTEFADALVLEFPGFRTKRDHCLSHQMVVFFIMEITQQRQPTTTELSVLILLEMQSKAKKNREIHGCPFLIFPKVPHALSIDLTLPDASYNLFI